MTMVDDITESSRRNLPPPGVVLENKMHGAFRNLADFVACVYHSSTDSRADQVRAIQNAMSERVPSDGGFLVPEEYRTDLVEASLESAIIRPAAQKLPMRSLRLGVPAVDETTHVGSLLGGWVASWFEENTSITDTTPGMLRDVLEAKKLAAFTTIDNELFEDAAALQAFLKMTLPKAIAWWEDDAFITGSGQGEPKGFINASCAINVTRASPAFLHTDIVNMIKRLWAQGWHAGTARFLCGEDTLGLLIDTFQNFGSATTGAISNNPQLWYDFENKCWRLFGVPLTVTEHTSAAGTAGDLILIDPSAYVIGDREIMTLQISPHPKFNLDQSVIRVRHRVDGRVWPPSAVTPASGAATVSPVVVLN